MSKDIAKISRDDGGQRTRCSGDRLSKGYDRSAVHQCPANLNSKRPATNYRESDSETARSAEIVSEF